MAGSALRELDKLRKMLEPSTPGYDRRPETPQSTRSDRSGLSRRIFSNVPELQQAEERVTLMSRAMDTAEAEMDDAVNRTSQFLHVTESRLHGEVEKLQSMLDEKERTIDDLRAELALAQRQADVRVQDVESNLQATHNEVRQLRHQVRSLEDSNSASHSRCRKLEGQAATTHSEMSQALRDSAAELQEAEQGRAELHAKNAALEDRLRRGRHDADKQHAVEMDGARTRISNLEHRLREVQREADRREASRTRTEALLEDLREHMRHDCRTAQGWLRKELQSQEQTEAMLLAAKDIIRSKHDTSREPREVLKQLQEHHGR